MHIGKIIVTLFLITCSVKKEKVQTVPSNAVVEKTVNKTESSISKTPAHIIWYLFNFHISVLTMQSISFIPSLFIHVINQYDGKQSNHG